MRLFRCVSGHLFVSVPLSLCLCLGLSQTFFVSFYWVYSAGLGILLSRVAHEAHLGVMSSAQVPIFPASASPLVAFTINVNYSQIRNSSLTIFADPIARQLGKIAKSKVSKTIQEQVVAE